MELLPEICYWIIAGTCLLGAAATLFCLGAWFYTSPRWRALFATLNRQFRSLPPFGKLVAIVFLAVFIAYGGGKTNNAPPPSPPPGGMVFDGGIQMQPEGGEFSGPRLTTNQYRAGFALVRVSTNAARSFAVPSNAVLHAPWTRYGVAEDTFWLPATNWSFPLGTNRVEGLHVSSSGTLSFGWPKGSPRARGLPDGSALDFLAPLQTSSGIAPPVGRFWHAPTPSNSLLLTWQDVYANRNTNYPVSFQSEIFWNGDFTFRYDFSSLKPQASSLPTTNFVVGAQHNGGGETYAFGDTNSLVNGLELRWRGFGPLDPGLDDHDGDGLSSYDEVMIHGTDPRLADSDRDGLGDADELLLGTGPRNPDTDGDGLADGDDANPLVFFDPDGDADGDGIGNLYEFLHGLDPLACNLLDTDQDGWPNWQERLAGTGTNSARHYPGDSATTTLYTANITLNADLSAPAILEVAGRRVVLGPRRTLVLHGLTGVGYTVTLTPSVPGRLNLSIAFSNPYVGLDDPGGLFTPHHRTGTSPLTALFALPVLTAQPERICFHNDEPLPVFAAVRPMFGGVYAWTWPAGELTTEHNSALITWTDAPGEAWLELAFLPRGASEWIDASRLVTRCTRSGGTGGGVIMDPADDPIDNGEPGYGSGGTGGGSVPAGLPVAMNNDDDNANMVIDIQDTPCAGENDLVPIVPLGRYDGTCCPCPEHRPQYAASATLASCSPRLELYADAGKTNFFSGTVLAGETVHVEGRSPSASVGAETVVWEWTDSQQQTQQLCQRFTVFSLWIFGDINLNGTVDTVDRALQTSLPGHGWAMPSAPGVLHPLLLQTDNQLPGRFTLGLGGTPGAFRIWRTAQPGTNDTPLLVCGRAVTNGVGGAYFAEFGGHDLYVAAISNGTAVLTYTYAGTGAAEGLFCSASLRMTALAARLEPVTTASNNQGVIYNPAGVAVGGLALYRVEVEPGEGIPDTAIHWSRNNGNVAFYDGHDTGREAIVRGVAPGDYKLEVSIDGLPSTYRPYIHGRVLEPKTVPIYAYIICSNGVPAVSVDTVNAWVAEANRIYRQVAMTFVLESVQHVISNDWFNIGNYIELLQMCAHASNTGGLELYCVNNMGAAGVNLTGCGMAVRANAKLYVLAHEIGHACGLRDIIDSPVGIAVSEALSGASNWSGGEGTGYHDPALKHDALVRRLLMHHVAGLQKVDIPRAGVTGRTHGLTIDSFISVGLANMSTREPRH